MKQNLLKALDERKIFKLILGLGNQDCDEIQKTVEIYALAGADMIDINPSEKAVQSVFCAIEKAGKSIDDFYFAVSTGLCGDTHIQKCFINTAKCVNCGKCTRKCPRNAIVSGGKYPKVVTEKCIGCKKCKGCKAISFCETQQNIQEVVSIAEKYNLDCVELHLSTKKIPDKEIKYIINNFKGILSLCLDRKYYSNERLNKLINKVIKWNKGRDFIIQADGVPMSGGDDSFSSTLQAVSMAHLVQDYGTYIFLSGGTNSKTAELAKMCGLRYNGISVGSYARKIIRNKTGEEAVKTAKDLIKACRND